MGQKDDRAELVRLRARVAELERLLKAHEQAARSTAPPGKGMNPIGEHAEALRAIAAGTATALGGEFFPSLVANLASALNVRYIYIGTLCEPKRDRIATLAAWADGKFQENFEYDLAGTPCEQVVARGLCYYCQDVQQVFPEDRFLVDMGVQSYCGTPLLDRSGRVM
ncbi:MAG: hypothetical protein ACKOCD_05040, partial [Nitrospiraceae bacterium]